MKSTSTPSADDMAASLVRRLCSYRLPAACEAVFQDSVATVLTREAIPFVREFELGHGLGRIDFYIEHARVGLELKVKGSPSDVIRQLQRYTRSTVIDALVLVTARNVLGRFVPPTLGGKPLHVAAVWRGGL